MNDHDSALKYKDKPPFRACMLAYTFYETDGRVMRYAEALAQDGATVEAIVLRRDNQAKEEVINGVKVLRIQRRVKNEIGKFSYLARILMFFFRSMAEITRRHLKEPYDVIHVHSVPDFEVFATFVPKLLGAKVILDIHDIVPEFYAAKFKVRQDSLVFCALKFVEKVSATFADHVIIANDLWREKLTTRSVSKDNCSSFINYPDISIFNPNLNVGKTNEKFIMIYPGTLNWHQGLDIAVNALAIIKDTAPNIELHIYGEGSAKAELQKQIADLQLSDKVFLRSPLPLREIAVVMANADLGIVPKRNDSFGGDAFSTKILEFMALGTPVVVADTRIDQYYFNESLLRFFKAGDVNDLARVMLDAYHNRELSNQLATRALTFARQHSWETKKSDYLTLIEQLTQGLRSNNMRIDRFLTLHCVRPIRRMLGRDKGLQIPILMYHSISEQIDNYLHPYYQTVTSPERFEQQMRFLNQSGYKVLTLSEAMRLLKETSVPNNPTSEKLTSSNLSNSRGPVVVITFDDGLRDFYTTAFPILEKFSFKATVFLTSGLINKNFITGCECLRETEIHELADKGIEFGSHTDSHPQLKKLSTDDIINELSVSKTTIEAITSSPVNLFSYPYKFPEEDQHFTKNLASLLATQGYSAGVTTIIGNTKSGDNPLFLKRLPINDYDETSFFQAKLQGDYDWLHTIQLTTKKLRAIL